MNLSPARLCVRSAPLEHLGLGVGTQLSLAVARAVLKLAGRDGVAPAELARLTGRGCRSGVGLHGFQHGGLIVDGGQKHDTGIPPLVARMPFPNDWFTKDDPTSATGRRVDLTLPMMPRNVAGKPIEPQEWNRGDGFSAGAQILTLVPGMTKNSDLVPSGLPPVTAATPAPVPAPIRPPVTARVPGS